SDVQSRDQLLRGELALDSAGRISALRVHSTPNLGAYVAPSIPISTLSNMERMISGLYAIPAIHLRVEGALTNTVPLNVYRGVGPDVEGTGGVPQEFAEVRVQPDGVIEVPIGAMSQGQGHETVFAQVVAERLGVPFGSVRIVAGDTDRVAKGVGTFASRSMV